MAGHTNGVGGSEGSRRVGLPRCRIEDRTGGPAPTNRSHLSGVPGLVRQSESRRIVVSDSPSSPLKPELFRLATAAVRDGLTALRAAIKGNPHLYIPGQWDWREIAYRENGMPTFNQDEKAGPPDYSYLFGKASQSGIDTEALPTFRAFVDSIVADAGYRASQRHRYRDDISEEDLTEMVRMHAEMIPADLVEQFQIVFPDASFEDDRLLPLYLRWEERLFADHIPVEFVIPLLMTTADFEEYRLGADVVIRRMGDAFQRARAGQLHWDRHVHEWAAQAATHALVVEGRTLSAEQRRGLGGYPWELNDHKVYPIRQVDTALASIRIATGIVAGYAQVIIHHRHVNSEHADRFPLDLHGVPVRRYPTHFDHWGWLRAVPVITTVQAKLASELFGRLVRLPDTGTLAIAARRINDCHLRDRQDDAILDAVIAFETLLSDDDHHELTHKLALRVAALLRLEADPPRPPFEAFREIKRIYQYRSKLVHGKAREAEKDVKKYFDGEADGPLVAALRYLRVVMRLLLQNEQYRDPGVPPE